MKKFKNRNNLREKLGFGYLGNGITVWDSNRKRNGDYLTVAHIAYDRTVKFYAELSPEAIRRIENFAKYNNSCPATQPHMLALKPLDGSSFMSLEEKDSFLREYECSDDGIALFINKIWDDKLTPLENLKSFRLWRKEDKEK